MHETRHNLVPKDKGPPVSIYKLFYFLHFATAQPSHEHNEHKSSVIDLLKTCFKK